MTYLTVEDVFGRGLLELDVPHQSHAVRLVGGVFVVVIGGHQELWVLGRRRRRRMKRKWVGRGEEVGEEREDAEEEKKDDEEGNDKEE